eukprot:CAMPEP_0182498884 /NCGR_PEP_ID=MMETSP1321-20130603/6944_1 /TAXON_ID=91990 /ORGANISM="Bolidomonas sp., Strain RCC1657" /LENGTH=195 /DNA_ID=CAMNT_0024702995 /DNA_START=114 /DNA_END=698 /DNA_ORIENTATION=+
MNALGLLVVGLLALSSLVGATVHNAEDHDDLFNLISNYCYSAGCMAGNNIVTNGDSVIAAVGTFSGAPYANSDAVYFPLSIYFSLVCSGVPHSCILNGANSRMIMRISGTGSGTITISGMTFKDGDDMGVWTTSSARVTFEASKFVSCSTKAIQVQSSGTVNLYATVFSATNGDDIYLLGGSATVHSTCPPDWSG